MEATLFSMHFVILRVLGSHIYFGDLKRVIAFLGNAILSQVGFHPDGEISEHKDRMSFASDTVTLHRVYAFLRNARRNAHEQKLMYEPSAHPHDTMSTKNAVIFR